MRQWRRMQSFAAVCLLASAFCAVGSVGVFAQGDSSPQGIFVDGGKSGQTAVEFNVLLERDGRKSTVNSNYRFQDGDRMRFQFELNRAAYVYVVHREFEGDPSSRELQRVAGPNGIEVVRDDDRRRRRPESPGSGRRRAGYQLLFPNEEAGRNNRLDAGKVHTIPAGRDLYFTMDDRPGIEKLYLVASPRELDIADLFELSDGSMRTGNGGGTDDTDDDVLSQLSAKLAVYAANAVHEYAPSGINLERDRDNYGAGRDPRDPFMSEVDLAHHARPRRGRR